MAASSSQINLTWVDTSDNEKGFKIERKAAGGSWKEIAADIGKNVVAYSDKGLSAGTYTYRIKAYNDAGDSDYSAEASAEIGVAPAAPSNLTAKIVSKSIIELSWTDNADNEEGFKIERKIKGGSYSQIGTVGRNVTKYTSTGLSANKTYYFRVRAYNASGNSSFSNEVSVTTSAPSAPSNLTAERRSNTVVDLEWNDNSDNETGFKIERKKEGGKYAQIDTVGGDVTTYTDSGLSSNTTYFYRVRAYNSIGDSSYCTEVSVATTSLGSPSNLVAETASNSRINLSWKDNATNETGFKIERRTAGGSYKQIDTVGRNVTSYSDTGLSATTTYYYRVRAYNSVGNSSYSNEAVIARGALSAPTKLKARAVSGNKITLTWADNNDNETGFKIERRTAGGSYKQIATVGADITEYSDTGLSPGTTYYYRVRAYNFTGNSAYSSAADATTTAEAEKVIIFNIGRASYYVNNQRLEMDAAPIIIEGRAFLPIRYLAEVIGAEVGWNQYEKKATVTFKGKDIELWIGKYTARVDGEPKLIDSQNIKVVPVVIPPGRTMLPLRFISENLGCKVDWNANSQEVKVTYPAP